jgi:hypothetical protein
MRKGLASILLLGILTSGCLSNKFEKISRDHFFKIKDYTKYFKGSHPEVGEDMVILGYDLNKDGNVDCIAKAKMVMKHDTIYTFPYASSLTVNPDGNGDYNAFYFDSNNDGLFDFVFEKKEAEPESDNNSVSM